MDQLIKNGDSAYKKAKQELKTGVFKWKPDYNGAVSLFEEAGKCYKNGKAYDKALLAFEQSILCNKKLNDAWGVARGLEATVEILLTNPQLIKSEDHLIELAREASQYFKAEDSYTNMIKLYIKLSKFQLDHKQPDQAIDIAKEAYEASIESDKKYNFSEILNFYSELLISHARYNQAIELYKKQIKLLKIKNTKVPLEQYGLLIVSLCLITNEPIRANNELNDLLNDVPDIYKTDEYSSAQKMLDAYDNGEQDVFDKLISRPPINLQFPVIVPRLLKKLKVKQTIVSQQLNTQAQQQSSENNQNIEQNLENLKTQEHSMQQINDQQDEPKQVNEDEQRIKDLIL